MLCAICGDKTDEKWKSLCEQCITEHAFLLDDEKSREWLYSVSRFVSAKPTREEFELVFHNNPKLIALITDGLARHPELKNVMKQLLKKT